MSVLVNLKMFDLEEIDIKTIIGYLTIDQNSNSELIKKIIKLGNYIKK